MDVARCAADGMEFFSAANDVILCSGNGEGKIPPRYFKSVLNAETRSTWRPGDW